MTRWLLAGVAGGVVGALALGALALGAIGDDAPPVALAPPRFVPETETSGLEHEYDGDFEYFVGGGVAVLDCNADSRPDLYIAGGANAASLFRNDSAVAGPLTFTEVVDATVELDAVTGAYPLDIDGDAIVDLAVLRNGENVLLRGRGDCRFERANETWGFDGGDAWTTAFSATWEAGADFPTLAIGNYLDLSRGRQDAGCADHALVRPTAGGTTFGPATPLTPGRCTLSMLFSDWDRSGRRDLRLTNDRHYDRDGEDQLWRVAAGEAARLYTRDDGWQALQIWGMGIASHDLTGDRRPEVFLTSQGDNKLQTLIDGATGPHYKDIAIRRGVTAQRPYTGGDVQPSTAWHAEFQDVNNDGLVDLYVAKGNVEAMSAFAQRDPNNLLLGQADGTFMESAEAAGIVTYTRTRGAALVDLNLDGMLDLVEVNRRERVDLWRNVGWGDATQSAPMGNWVAIRLTQPGPNRDAIGAWIEVQVGDRTIHRELTVGGGHAGGQLGWIHLGLGTVDHARLRVVWPDGDTGAWLPVRANGLFTVERGAAEAQPWVRAAGTGHAEED